MCHRVPGRVAQARGAGPTVGGRRRAQRPTARTAAHVRRGADKAGAPPFPGCPPAERILDMLGSDADPTECLQAAGADVDDVLGFASGAGRLPGQATY